MDWRSRNMGQEGRMTSVGTVGPVNYPGECKAHMGSECGGVGYRVVQQWGCVGRIQRSQQQ